MVRIETSFICLIGTERAKEAITSSLSRVKSQFEIESILLDSINIEEEEDEEEFDSKEDMGDDIGNESDCYYLKTHKLYVILVEIIDEEERLEPPLKKQRKKKKMKETRTIRRRSERISENKEKMNISVHDDLIGGIRKKKKKKKKKMMREIEIELEKKEKEEKAENDRFDQRMRDLISACNYQEEREKEEEGDYEEPIVNLSSTSSEKKKKKKKKVDPINFENHYMYQKKKNRYHQSRKIVFGQEQKFIMFVLFYFLAVCVFEGFGGFYFV